MSECLTIKMDKAMNEVVREYELANPYYNLPRMDDIISRWSTPKEFGQGLLNKKRKKRK